MNKFKIEKEGKRYIIKQKGLFFWSTVKYNACIIADFPLMVPVRFNTLKEAKKYILEMVIDE